MEQLGRWILEERIGVGGVADVWRAVDPVTRQQVALKILREPDRSLSHRDRFLREGRLLQRLAFKGLPSIYEVDAGPQPFLAIELLEGETLGERIRSRGPLPLSEVEAIAAALLRVLGLLHGRGVLHRDIKASNIFLSDDGRVLLLDLGLAADPTDPLITTLGDVMGTYAYMAPEQIAGAEVDLRCDLYSLGITLYEALAGTRPFHAADAAGYLRAHREGRPPSLQERRPEAPTWLTDPVLRMMARDPAARPASAAVALAMLTGTGGARRTLARPPMVGRSAALGAVQAILDGGGVVAVLGEVGSGTGRVATDALNQARLRGFETIAVRCNHRSMTTDPLLQLARDLSQIMSAYIDPEPDIIAASVADLAAEGPLFILVESVEQCSPEAAAVFARILRPNRMLAALYTGVDMPPGLQAYLVHLRPLNQDETHAMLVGMLGTQGVPSGLAEDLHRMSGGLPAVVALAARELANRGALRHVGVSDEGEPVWQLDRVGGIVPTLGLARLFGDVLLRLPEDAQSLLEVLAVSGDALPLRAALEAAGADLSGLSASTLARESLVQIELNHAQEWISLRRPAVGALVLAQTPESRQLEVHRRLARALSRLPREGWRDARLAWHTAFGAGPDSSASALLQLGEQLCASGQPSQALDVLDRAAQQPNHDIHTTTCIAVTRGEALALTGRTEAAGTTLRAALELARGLSDDALCARVLVLLAELHAQEHEGPGAVPMAEQALSLLANLPTHPIRPRALLAAANAHRVGAEPDLAAARYHQCIDEGMAQGQREYAAMAHGGLGLLLAEAGRLDDAIRHLEQEVAFLRARTMPSRLIHVLYRISQIRLRLGEIRLALENLSEADTIARLSALPYDRALAEIGRASILLQIGARAQASALLKSARVALEPDAAAHIRLAYRLIQGELRMSLGDHQAALASFQAAESEALAVGFHALGAYSLGMSGVLTADADALTRAMEVLGRSGDRSLTARLLLHGARVGGDAEVLHSAESEARSSRDLFVLLAVLHAVGSDEARREARAIARQIEARTPGEHRSAFAALPAVAWAMARADALLDSVSTSSGGARERQS